MIAADGCPGAFLGSIEPAQDAQANAWARDLLFIEPSREVLIHAMRSLTDCAKHTQNYDAVIIMLKKFDANGATKSVWLPSPIQRFPKVGRSANYDVAIVGGGITGLTAAWMLAKQGKSVCVVERDRLGLAETAHTTAHLTCVTDLRLGKMAKTFGESTAQAVWQAGAMAVDTINRLVEELQIECEFRRVPGYLQAAWDGRRDESKTLAAEADLARKLGFEAQFVERTPLADKPGIRFANQAIFHPLKYLAGVAARLADNDSCDLFERSEVSEVSADPLTLHVGRHRVQADYVIIATHVPIVGVTPLAKATLLQTKLYPYSTYAVSARVPKGSVPAVSLWDTSDPYYYLRIEEGDRHDVAILGGEDHKTGQASDTKERFDRLSSRLEKIIPRAVIDRRWSGQVIETNDGLPYMGETTAGQFVATGFSGNGMTFGTVAGIMAASAALGSPHPWQPIFDVGRKKLRGGTWDFVKENVDYPFYLVKDRLSPHARTARDVKRGEGAVLRLNGEAVACSRDAEGKLKKVSAVCTHMGCLVRWNKAEQTWDCPCHGSRFATDGKVIGGPAETPLPKPKSGKSS